MTRAVLARTTQKFETSEEEEVEDPAESGDENKRISEVLRKPYVLGTDRGGEVECKSGHVDRGERERIPGKGCGSAICTSAQGCSDQATAHQFGPASTDSARTCIARSPNSLAKKETESSLCIAIKLARVSLNGLDRSINHIRD